MEWNDEQERAIEQIVSWYRQQKIQQRGVHYAKQVFFLTGDAGTGKTSIARSAAERCVPAYNITYIAPTGKAAARLKQKGCRPSKTIHSFACRLIGEDEHGDPIFEGKAELDEHPLLIVLDEASMVDDDLMGDVLDHNILTLALGDLKQLQPVNASPYLTDDHIDYRLTQIMRQAADSNILKAAQFVSQGYRLPPREYPDVKVRRGMPPLSDLLAHAGEDSQIICYRNTTRNMINADVREALGYTAMLPQQGEKIMCWFNQHGYGVMNGEQGIVLDYRRPSISDQENDFEYLADMMMVKIRCLTDNVERWCKFNPDSFCDDSQRKMAAQRKPGGWDFGYCSTAHKAQGSEWLRVLIVAESMKSEDYPKWMYTAVTRAQEHLMVYRLV